MAHRLLRLLPLLLILSCATRRASVSTGGEAHRSEASDASEAAGPVELPKWPWTDAFLGKSALFADRVVIRGPRGLLEHTVVQQDLEHYEIETETLPEGFRQITRAKPGVEILEPIRAQLDSMQIMAVREIVLLERPGPVDVEVIATGDAFHHEIATGRERRDQRLVLEGPVSREEASQ